MVRFQIEEYGFSVALNIFNVGIDNEIYQLKSRIQLSFVNVAIYVSVLS